jgi:hypothetical protein
MRTSISPDRFPRATRPLPLCPRPFPDEGVTSWIHRLSHVYGYTEAKFLRALELQDVTRSSQLRLGVLTPTHIKYLAFLARLRARSLRHMCAIPSAWVLSPSREFAVCLECWRDDHRRYGRTYDHSIWQHAGRISCRKHHTWLWPARAKFGPKYFDSYRAANESIPSDLIDECIANIQHELKPHGRGVISVDKTLLQMESAILEALRGWPPDAAIWGSLTASDLLQVISDVTAFALTNFESFRARQPAENLVVACGVDMPFFMAPRWHRSPPWEKHQRVMTLQEFADPKVRRNAPCGWHTH